MMQAMVGQQGVNTKITPYKESKDIELFLHTFEMTMIMRDIPENKWTSKLVPVLAGRAREVAMQK